MLCPGRNLLERLYVLDHIYVFFKATHFGRKQSLSDIHSSACLWFSMPSGRIQTPFSPRRIWYFFIYLFLLKLALDEHSWSVSISVQLSLFICASTTSKERLRLCFLLHILPEEVLTMFTESSASSESWTLSPSLFSSLPLSLFCKQHDSYFAKPEWNR